MPDDEAYRLLFEHCPAMVCTLDLEGRITAINRAGERLTGYAAADAVGRLAVELIAPEHRDEAARQFEARVRSAAESDLERPPDLTSLLTRDGRRVPVEVTSSVLVRDGEVIGVLGLVADLSDRENAERATRQGEERFRALLESAPDAVVIAASDGTIEVVNAQAEKLFGYERDELVGESVELLVPAELRLLHGEHRSDYLTDPRARSMGADLPLSGRRKDGTTFPIDVSLSPLDSDAGTLVMAAVRDVTLRVESERALAEREQRYRLLAENSTDVIGRFGFDGTVLYVSPACESTLGHLPEDLVGTPIQELVHPDDLADPQTRAALTDETGEPVVMEARLRHRDGRWLWFEATVRGVRDPATGAVTEWQAALRLIETRKQAETQLRDAEARFRGFFENAPIGEAIVAPDGRFLEVNRALCAIVGYAEDELLEKTFQEITHPDDVAAAVELAQRVLAGELETYQIEKRYVRADGGVVRVLLSVSLVRDEDGRPSYFIAQIQDVTAAKEAQEARERNEARLADAQEVAQLGSWEFDYATNTVTLSRELHRISGLDGDAAVTPALLQERVVPEDLEVVLATVSRRLEPGESAEVEFRVRLPDGSVRWLYSRSKPVVRGGVVVGRRGIAQDITERKATDERLRRAELRYRTLVEQLPLGMYVRPLDMSKPNMYASPQVEPMLGYTAEEWQSDPDLFPAIVHPDDRDRVLSAARRLRETGEPFREEYRYLTRDGRVVWVQDETYLLHDADGEPFVQGYLLDITPRKQAEADRDRLRDELQHAQRLEAIGRLAGGVAHDFNNMLTAIKGYSELLLAELEPATGPYQHATQIKRAANQAATLPEQLLAFGRRQALEPRAVDLNELISGTVSLLRHLISEAIEVVVRPAAGPAVAHVDPGRVEQAVVNLALNARDAMPTGGTLTMSTEIVDVGEQALEHGATPGRYVLLSVADTGHGMAEETQARAFEPFFTTKPQGKGSGLGLSSVYGTVSQSGGFVTLESEEGAGSVLRMYLPADVTAELQPEGPGERSVEVRPLALLAEDEDIVRDLVERILTSAGFDVRAVDNGADALGWWETSGETIAVLVTDIVMPRLGGQELAARIRARSPETPVVFMSGYTEAPPDTAAYPPGSTTFLRKPFSTESLLEAVRGATAGRTPAGATRTRADHHPITCVVADDHAAVRDSVSRFLESEGIAVVAQASTADEAIERIESARPATALVDVRMEPFSGIEVAKRASSVAPGTGTVLYTGFRDEALLQEALAAGVRGFVLKDGPLSEVVEALVTVADGGTYVDERLARAVTAAASEAQLRSLTRRERQILTLLAEGLTNERVAAQLEISPETVQSHVRNAMTKLDADTRTQAVATAIRKSLIE